MQPSPHRRALSNVSLDRSRSLLTARRYGLVLLGWVGRDSIGSLPLMRCLMYGALISCECAAR